MIFLAIFLLALIFLYIFLIRQNPNSQIDRTDQKSINQSQLNPVVLLINGTDLIYQIPDSPKAVLFLAHGCSNYASKFWDKSPNCPNCEGLPEDRKIIIRALEQKFAVFAISSLGKCWSFGKEVQTVKNLINWWLKSNNLEHLPLVGLGASSGGNFISALATQTHFKSIVIMIAEGIFRKLKIIKDYPATLFVHMPKDVRRLQLIERNMELLKSKGLDVKDVKCDEFPLKPGLFSERIPGLDFELSVELFGFLKKNGIIDENGFMRKDGRDSNWKVILKDNSGLYEKCSKWIDHIQEELNLAYGYHEMTSLQLDEIFEWFNTYIN
ncbi:hypothetical protein LUZ60_008428 [Juncus effusus]|nr:hypothetical protein LUZ60_008428 [Juncus effusus]